MSNSKKSVCTQEERSNQKRLDVESSRVVIIKDGLDESSDHLIISLQHSKHEQKTKFFINKSLKKLYEVQATDEIYNSWLINDSIRTDGSVYMITPIDPLFIILPHFKQQCSNRAVPLHHMLSSADDSELSKLSEIISDLNNIGDIKGPANLCAYKYNEEKTLNWLKKKVERVARVLKDKNVYVKSGAVSATFVASSIKENNFQDESYTKFAVGIISEYLNDELSNQLEKQYVFKEEENVIGKRKSSVGSDTLSKKVKMIKTESPIGNEIEVKSEYFDTKMKSESPKTTISSKSIQDKKAAVGTKSIMSFFSKK